MTTCSRNEVSTLFVRAARAANYSWGQAEEIGQAMQLSCDLDRRLLATTAQYLADKSDTGEHPEALLIGGHRWQGKNSKPVCPLVCGMALNDWYGATDAPDLDVEISQLSRPVLLIPFVRSLAKRRHQTIEVSFDSWQLSIGWDSSVPCANDAIYDVHLALTYVSSRASRSDTNEHSPSQSDRSPIDLDDSTWHTLLRLAGRTYVPATDAGRLSGAGAGLNDND